MRVESLTHAVEREELLPIVLRCEIAVFANLEPTIVKLTDPERGGEEKTTLTGEGAVNDIAFEIKEQESKVTTIDALGPEPRLAFVTTADSDTHT